MLFWVIDDLTACLFTDSEFSIIQSNQSLVLTKSWWSLDKVLTKSWLRLAKAKRNLRMNLLIQIYLLINFLDQVEKKKRVLLCGVANPNLTWSLRISWPSDWMVNWLVKRTSSKHSFIGVSKAVESSSLCKSKRISLTWNVTCGSQSPKSMSAISQELIAYQNISG